jgi:hypothetical protein
MLKKILFVFCIFSSGTIFGQDTAEKYGYPLDLNSINLKLPKVEDQKLDLILKDKDTVFYKLKQVWQHYVPPSKVEHVNQTLGTKTYTTNDLVWGLYYSTYNPDAHANFNFPWETTVGLNTIIKTTQGQNFKTVNFISLPKDENGKILPIWYLREAPIKWIFPAGTTVGEIIYVINNNEKYIQEIRTRTKSEDCEVWEPHLYRPIANKQEFIRYTQSPDFISSKKFVFLRNPQEDEVFRMEGNVEILPELTESKVKSILSLPFKEVTSENWSPSSSQDFSILPKDYCFSLLKSVDVQVCAECHRQTQISVRNLVPKDPSVIKDPVGTGNIRGSDAVFTWHPFSDNCIRTSDKDPVKALLVRKYDTENGYIKVLSEIPKENRYNKLTKFVQMSLKDYELPKEKIFLHETKLEETNEEKLTTEDISVSGAFR